MKLTDDEKGWFEELSKQRYEDYLSLNRIGILNKYIENIVDTYKVVN